MLFNQIVVQQVALHSLDAWGIAHEPWGEGLHTADSVEATAALIYRARKAAQCLQRLLHRGRGPFGHRVKRRGGELGARAPRGPARGPVVFRAKAVLDATGHHARLPPYWPARTCNAEHTPTGEVMWEGSLDVTRGEAGHRGAHRRVVPGAVWVWQWRPAGVTVSCRMGPIFGGMQLSGVRAAGSSATAIGL
jgi:thiamine thiazole synthase